MVEKQQRDIHSVQVSMMYLGDAAPVFGGYPGAVLAHKLVGVPSKACRPDSSLPRRFEFESGRSRVGEEAAALP